MKKFTTILLIILALTLPTFAAESSVEYVGGAEKFVFLDDADLFDNFKGVMPGDELTQNIKIENKTRRCDYVKLYFKAVPHDETNVPVNGISTDYVAMSDFLAQLDVRVEQGDREIYAGKADGLEHLTENIYLGTFNYGDSTTLTITLNVPIELGNEYSRRVGEVDWVFTAEQYNKPFFPFFPQTTPAVTTEPPKETTIPEETTQPEETTAPKETTIPAETTTPPEETTAPEETTVSKIETDSPVVETTPSDTTPELPPEEEDTIDTPQTDDTTEILPYVIMVTVGVCGILVVVLSYRKEKSSKK